MLVIPCQNFSTLPKGDLNVMIEGSIATVVILKD